MKYSKWTGALVMGALLVTACNQSDYTRMVKKELDKGVRQDSILFGISFGNTRDEFYGRCFDLNRQQLVTQGPDNTSVQYIFTDSLVHKEPVPLRMLFYPRFDSVDRISDMYVEFSYLAWAPWNRELQSDSLENKVIELLQKWYGGNKFITATVSDQSVPVKVDGNRRILVSIKDTQTVRVNLQDILHPKFKHSITK